MSTATATTAVARNPYAEPAAVHPVRFLHALNPLAKLAAPLPVMIALLFTRGVAIPLAFIALTLVLLLVGARLSGRALVGAARRAARSACSCSASRFGVWVDPSRIDDDERRGIRGARGGGRLAVHARRVPRRPRDGAAHRRAARALAHRGPHDHRARSWCARSCRTLRVPYRLGYTALAALRFVPRFRHELEVIRAAHRVRGTDGGRGPVAAVRRTISYAIPLLASAIRHAERVALAMDARAFGAHPTRTERTVSRWRPRDTVFVALFWITAAAIYAVAFAAGA